ncbi:MAG: PAS domain-containing protein, partial [Desulfobacula sp.]|nr:PAS domain-containing protein [Desulfobacula sp.]
MTDLTYPMLDHDNLNLVLDNLKIGIIAHTPERIITVFNKEAERITGYLKKEVIGKDCHTVFQAPFCGEKCSFCDGIPNFSFGSKEYPLNIVTKDGSARQLEMTVSAIISHDNIFKGVLASFRDMTESFNLSLKAETLSNFADIIGKHESMQDVFRQIRDVALYNYPVNV